MKIGLVGKPNVGKSTFFAAATLVDAAIGNYPFTTIKPNHGVGFVRVADPGAELKVQSSPKHGKLVGATRYVHVELVDVAGLVPGAHEGRGLGNQFLSDLNPADALLHIVDASGGTDAEGNSVPPGTRDPMEDVRFLEMEMDAWILGILRDGWDRLAKQAQASPKKAEAILAERLGGIGVTEPIAAKALRDTGHAGMKLLELTPHLAALATALRRAAKPIVVVLNKADAVKPEQLARLEAALAPTPVVRASAQSELALAKGAAAGVLDYAGGAGAFTPKTQLNPAQQKGLDYIRDHVLAPLGSTGVHKAIEAAVFQLLGRIPVFPVEDEAKLTDKDGRVLPDCHLVPAGTTAKQLAAKVHTDLAEHFIRAIDCRTHRTIGAEHELKAGDVVKIVAKA
ncbi:MAG: YchF-related putative GTPase [Candidatus Thermoplasmatota archaeon]